MTPRRGCPPGMARRALDVVVAGGALLVLAPVFVLVTLAVLASGPGGVLFRQPRVGQGGSTFVMYKFRSMRPGLGGVEVTAPGDSRVTRVGALLRRSSLDELPQLLNVLRGDMTLVGPRPETPGLAARYPLDCRWVFAHRPGVTGPSQLRYREFVPDTVVDVERWYLTELVPRRVALDEEFLVQPTLGRTLGVLAATARHLVVRLAPGRP